MAKKPTKPTIEEEIESLGHKLYPKAARVKLTRRKRPGVSPNDVDQEFRFEWVLIVRQGGNQIECKADSPLQLKANLKRLAKAKEKISKPSKPNRKQVRR